MKYYAVTEDPNELFHYGVKGMKWGQHIFGKESRPKSAAYKRAASKLKASVKKTNATIKAARTQVAYNKRAKQEAKYQNAVLKAEKRNNAIASLHSFDSAENYRKQLARDQKAARIQSKLDNVKANNDLKAFKKSVKVEKKMPKVLQEAREGKLRFGNLSEEQISRVQERLQTEANARRLGGTEKSSWRQQKREARRAGKLEGIKRGTAAAMEEVARAGAQYGLHLINQAKLRSKAVGEAKNQRVKNRIQNKKTHGDLRRELKEEAYSQVIRDPNERDYWMVTRKGAAKYLKDTEAKKEQKALEAKTKQLSDDLYRKWLLGGKNDTPESIQQRIKQKDQVYKLIYGTTPGDKNGSSKSKNKGESSNGLFDNFDGTIAPRRRIDQVKDVGRAALYLPASKIDAKTKSIRRHYKKMEKRKKINKTAKNNADFYDIELT